MPVVIGAAEYPEGILEDLSKEHKVYTVNATEKQKKLGNPRVFNVICVRNCRTAYGFYKRTMV